MNWNPFCWDMTLSLSVLMLSLSWLCIVGDGWVEWGSDLPKLTTLVTVDDYSWSLMRPKSIILEGDSRCIEITNRHATSCECDSFKRVLLLWWSEYKEWGCVLGVIDRYWHFGESSQSHPQAFYSVNSIEYTWFWNTWAHCSQLQSEWRFSHCSGFDSIQESEENCHW